VNATSGSPTAFVSHLALGCKPAAPALDDMYLLSSLARSGLETVLLPPVPHLRWRHHLPRRCHHFCGLLPKPGSECQAGICGHRVHGTDGSCSSWPPGIVCAGVLVICLVVWLALRHAPSLTSSLNLVEVETLPSRRVLLSRLSTVLRSPPTSHPASLRISPFGLYRWLRWFCTSDQMRSLLFHRLLSQHPALPTPESSSRLLFRFFTASVAFAMRDRLGSLLLPLRG